MPGASSLASMDVGLEVWGADYRRIEAACQHADSLGLDGFAYGESPHALNLDCWTVLASLARSTERIRLGPVIANVLPDYRSALLLSRQVTTLSTIAPDRIELRTGVGAATRFARAWWEPHGITYPGYAQRLFDLAEALDTCQRHWRAAQLEIPVTLAATGARAMRLTARLAHVWETSFCTPTDYAARRQRFEAILDEVAPQRRVIRSLEVDGFVAPNAVGVDRLLAAVRSDRGANEDLGPVLERALVGTPTEVSEHLDSLAAVGVERVLVALHDPLDLDAITALAEASKLHHSRRRS